MFYIEYIGIDPYSYTLTKMEPKNTPELIKSSRLFLNHLNNEVISLISW